MKSSTRDKAEGTAKTISGNVKEKTGRMVGNPRLEAKGRTEKIDGKLQRKVGDVKKVVGR